MMLLEEVDMTIEAEHNKREIGHSNLSNNLLQMEAFTKENDHPFESPAKFEDWLNSKSV